MVKEYIRVIFQMNHTWYSKFICKLDSIKREDLQSSMKRRVAMKMGENPEEDEIELMFKLME